MNNLNEYRKARMRSGREQLSSEELGLFLWRSAGQQLPVEIYIQLHKTKQSTVTSNFSFRCYTKIISQINIQFRYAYVSTFDQKPTI